MVTTVLEARVEPERWEELRSSYDDLIQGALPRQLLVSSLMQDRAERTRWRITSEWVSAEGLQEYRDSVVTPDGVRLFREVGAEPALLIFDVVGRASGTGTGTAGPGVAHSSGKAPRVETPGSGRGRES